MIFTDIYILGSVQTLPLPLKDFRWDNGFGPELETFFRGRTSDYIRGVKTKSWDSYFGVTQKSTGYYIEVDISFPNKTKKNLRDFPPTPSHSCTDCQSESFASAVKCEWSRCSSILLACNPVAA